MTKILLRTLSLLATVAALTTPARATGYYGPSDYLGEGGTHVTGSPEFYWELETKRLARDFHPTEKLFVDTGTASDAEQTDPPSVGALAALADLTAKIDNQDFAEALKTGYLKPTDAAKATQQQIDARILLDAANDKSTDSPGAEFSSEFADYHRGAYAFRQGPAHYEEARKAWEDLLKRPAAERHYRSVWAAFMLGKLALKQGNPDAVKWFQMTRQLAKDGFADSLGMAADSYGWEGRSEWKQGHPDQAAPLYLNQLALGDPSAIISLKALLPDRSPMEGMLNYGPEIDEIAKWTDEQKKTANDAQLAAIQRAAADPLLSRLVTAHILATETGYDYGTNSDQSVADSRSARWLDAIKATKSPSLKDAEYLGWVAYNDGNYKEAARWLDLAPTDAPAALWLRAKLQLREGKLDDAAKNLAQAWQILRSPTAYTGWNPDDEKDPDATYDGSWTEGGFSFPQSASGDQAQLHLARNDFIQALDAFFKGSLWTDAAFVAERVLTADELKAYVDKLPPDPPAKEGDTQAQETNNSRLRDLLGRRLVREDRYAEAAPYLSPAYAKVLAKYAQALRDGANEKLSKQQRAQAWFAAAWLARYDGMDLMGTEVAPDGFDSEGSFEDTDLAKQRLSGEYDTGVAVENSDKTVFKPMPLPPTKLEDQRLEKNQIHPNVRYHYRNIASALALKAAALLKDNTDELADVLNAAGVWVKNTDEKAAFRVYKIIQTRCPKTEVGRASQGKDWFFDDPTGPMSDPQQAAYQALHQDAGLKTDSN
ncbi:hypothetical protein BH09VER1_BH09VER1_43340 [soil metagenome]